MDWSLFQCGVDLFGVFFFFGYGGRLKSYIYVGDEEEDAARYFENKQRI